MRRSRDYQTWQDNCADLTFDDFMEREQNENVWIMATALASVLDECREPSETGASSARWPIDDGAAIQDEMRLRVSATSVAEVMLFDLA